MEEQWVVALLGLSLLEACSSWIPVARDLLYNTCDVSVIP
jgi:hypothetical protein